jgi:hypothetical protein
MKTSNVTTEDKRRSMSLNAEEINFDSLKKGQPSIPSKEKRCLTSLKWFNLEIIRK